MQKDFNCQSKGLHLPATSLIGESKSLLNSRFHVQIMGGRPTKKRYKVEIWKDCVDYPELFEVSNLGNFRNKRNKKVLKQCLHQHGYLHLATKVGGRKGKNICFKIHREVAKAFLKNLKNLPCVNHKDGIKTNNNVDNLEWASYSENSRHAISLGLTVVPTNQLKLTNDQVKFIKAYHTPRDRDFGSRALGRKFSVDKSTIQRAFHSLTRDT